MDTPIVWFSSMIALGVLLYAGSYAFDRRGRGRCSNCGAATRPGGRFCARCGAPADQAALAQGALQPGTPRPRALPQVRPARSGRRHAALEPLHVSLDCLRIS